MKPYSVIVARNIIAIILSTESIKVILLFKKPLRKSKQDTISMTDKIKCPMLNNRG